MAKPILSVIIPTFNNAHIVPEVVASVFNQSLLEENYELIIIDDGSTDNTKETLNPYSVKANFRYFYQKNKGRSAARNFGIKEAWGEILVFLDSDKVIERGVLEEHLASQKQYPTSAVIGKTLLPPQVLNANIYMQVTREGEVIPKKKRKLPFPYFVTGNLSIAKRWVEEAGGFDESFKVYGWEDSELGLRLTRRGIELIYNPKIVCYHHHIHNLESQMKAMYKVGQSAWVFVQKEPSWNLKIFLGLHPVNFLLFKLWYSYPHWLGKTIIKIKAKEAKGEISNLAFLYNLVKQYYYIQGYFDSQKKTDV